MRIGKCPKCRTDMFRFIQSFSTYRIYCPKCKKYLDEIKQELKNE